MKKYIKLIKFMMTQLLNNGTFCAIIFFWRIVPGVGTGFYRKLIFKWICVFYLKK
jgi:hypothetical protein